MQEESAQSAIQRVDEEITEEKAKLKNLNEQIKDIKLHMPESQDVDRLQEELAAARTKLKVALESDPQYTSMCEEAAELKFKVKDLEEILSHHVSRFWRETDESQVLLPDGKRAKPVIIVGKLGKEEAYQERMPI